MSIKHSTIRQTFKRCACVISVDKVCTHRATASVTRNIRPVRQQFIGIITWTGSGDTCTQLIGKVRRHFVQKLQISWLNARSWRSTPGRVSLKLKTIKHYWFSSTTLKQHLKNQIINHSYYLGALDYKAFIMSQNYKLINSLHKLYIPSNVSFEKQS